MVGFAVPRIGSKLSFLFQKCKTKTKKLQNLELTTAFTTTNPSTQRVCATTVTINSDDRPWRHSVNIMTEKLIAKAGVEHAMRDGKNKEKLFLPYNSKN